MGYSFSKESLVQLKKCDLVKYFKSRFPNVPISRSGEYFIARCPHPDHYDENPSFRIHYDNKTGWYSWMCFSCHSGKKGEIMPSGKINRGSDAIAFVIWLSDYNGSPHIKTFQEATVELFNFFNIPLPEDKSKPLQRHEALNKTLFDVFYSKFPGSKAHKYALKRGLTEETIQKFMLCTNGDGLTIPLFDYYHRIQGFNTRSINGEEPKYIHSSEKSGFIKSEYLFGIANMDPSISHAIITEGCFDVMMATQYHVPNVVACLGTAFKDTHANLLADRHIKSVSIAFDGDSAGQNAVGKTIQIMHNCGIRCNVITLPDNMDLCDFALKHKEETATALKRYTQPDFEYLLKDFAKEYQEKKYKAQQECLTAILKQAKMIQEQEELDLFKQYIFDKFDIRLEKEYV